MEKINFYSRIITKRVVINGFGKLGYKSFKEVVKTRDIQIFNFKKKIKFELCSSQELKNLKKSSFQINQVESWEV